MKTKTVTGWNHDSSDLYKEGSEENSVISTDRCEQYAANKLSEYKQKLKAEIKIALIGIDKTDKHDYNGWWETSSGAEFGENKLIEVLTLIDKI